MLPPFAGRNPHSKFDSVHRGQVQSLQPEELPSHTKRHGDMITSLRVFCGSSALKFPSATMPLPEQDKSPPYTSKYCPWKFVLHPCFQDEQRAGEFERYLKSGSGHAFENKHFCKPPCPPTSKGGSTSAHHASCPAFFKNASAQSPIRCYSGPTVTVRRTTSYAKSSRPSCLR